jgi:glycosyltransferase involved in cell wall biosynthesis
LKICFCVPQYEGGGIGTVIYYEAKYLADAGYKVGIVTLNPKKDAPSNVELIRLAKPSEVNRLNCDIIHIHDGLCFIRALKHKYATYAAVVTYHGYMPWHLRPTYRDKILMPIYKIEYLRQLAKPIIKKVIAVSKYVSRDLIHINEKVDVIYNGVETRIFHPINNYEVKRLRNEKMGKPHLIYVGSFYKFKGVQDLLKAMHYISKNYPHSKLTMIGYGPLKTELERYVHNYSLSNVEVVGYIPHYKLPLYYNASDIFITASFYESFGLPIIEAAACGKPIIARNIPIMIEHATNCKSILTFNDIKEIPELISDILLNYEKFSQASLQYAKTLSWDIHVNKLIKLYNSLF